jgi:signal transduction histidine kinase
LRVRDAGKGIDPKPLSQAGRPGHYGLRGMRERAKVVGANWRCGARSILARR